MSEMWDVYVNDIHDNFKQLYANWPPNFPVALGDFGTLSNNVFNRQGNLQHFEIPFEKVSGADEQAHYSYVSSDATEINFHAKGEESANGVFAKAALEVKFSSKNAVLFEAADCSANLIDDEVALGHRLMDLLVQKKWNEDWCVVTKAVRAGATTVVISGSASASIVLEADANAPSVDLSTSAGLTVRSAKNIGYKVVTAKGMTPLIGFSKVMSHWFSDRDYGPVSAYLPESVKPYDTFDLVHRITANKIKREDVFYFGRVM